MHFSAAIITLATLGTSTKRTNGQTLSSSELCIKGPIKLTLKPECSLETIRSAYTKLYNDELVKDDSCTNTIDEDLKIIFFGDKDSEESLEDGAVTLCASADNGGEYPFHNIAGINGSYDSHFDKNFYDGGTYWNEEIETELENDESEDEDFTKRLKRDAAHVKRFYEDTAQYGTVEWPGQHSNFDLDTCDIHAAMCCWVQDRQAGDNNGNCKTPYDTNCIDKDPADNTDLIAVHLDKAPKSNSVKSNKGVILHSGDNAAGEGSVHCHGMAWSNDPNHFTSRYKGNNLFYISMYDHLHQRGYVRNAQGAPMCACLEQMPVVSRSDCTQTDLKEKFEVAYDPTTGEYNVKLTKIDVDFNACQGANNNNNNLAAYVERLTNEGHLNTSQMSAMTKILVGEGGNNRLREERRSLARAGIVRGFQKDAYEHILEFPSTDTHEFVHGICVVGASSVNAYSSDQRLYYTQYDGFADGQVAWKDRTYTLEGIDGSVCAGGIYLQPNAHKTIRRYTDIVVGANAIDDYLQVCGFVEKSFKRHNRDGNWDVEITPEQGFHIYEGAESGIKFVVDEDKKYDMTLFCRDFYIEPSAAPSSIPSQEPSLSFAPSLSQRPSLGLPKRVSMTLPQTLSKILVHGICVKGAMFASGKSTNKSQPTYKMVDNFKSGTNAWADRTYKIYGVENTPCEGGIYLEPSRHKSIGKGNIMELDFERETGNYDFMTVCIFVDERRNSGWIKSLPESGFTDYGNSFEGFQWRNSSGSAKAIHYTLCIDI